MPDHPTGQGPSVALCGIRRWQTITQDGHQMHAGKTKPHSPPTWVRLGLVGSILVFPVARAGLGCGVQRQKHPGLRAGVPKDSPITLLVLEGAEGGSPALMLGSDISPAPQHFSFPSRNEAIGVDAVARRSPELSLHLIQPSMVMQD